MICHYHQGGVTDGSSPAGSTSVSLLPFVPRLVLDDLLRHPGDSPVGREQRFDASALFADISGFTPMSDALGRSGHQGTEELTAILNGYFARMIELVDSYGGTVCKFGGDAVTVVFPERSKRTNAAERALACALEMQRETHRYGHIETSAGRFELAAKIGVACGRAMCTTVGDPSRRLEYVVAGSAIDLCTRAEQVARRGEVVAQVEILERCAARTSWRKGDMAAVAALDRRPRRVRSKTTAASRPDELPATLAAFLHPTVVQRLEGGLEAFVNEHRKLTVLFVGFAGPDYDNDPRAARRLQTSFERFSEIIVAYDAHLRQIDVGDKGSLFIVLFGAPVLHEDDETRALRCVRDLLDLPGEQLRAGVATGFTFCGCVGSAGRKEYAAVGDTVNVAARLMQAAKPGEALVATGPSMSAEVAALLDPRPPLPVKGKAEPIAIATLKGSLVFGAPHGERAYELPVIARERELQLGTAALDRAQRDAGGMLLITGEPGIGKSRLAAELAGIAAGRGFAVLSGSCQSSGAASSYLPWQEISRTLFELEDGAPTERQIEVLADRVRDINPDLESRLPLLAPVVRLPIAETEMTSGLDPELRAELLRALLLAILRARASSRARLLVLEDCHWIDPLSESLLEAIGRNVDRLAVLVIVLSREADGGFLTGLRELDHVTELSLGPLRRQEGESLARAKLRLAGREFGELPPAVENAIARADGNPFFLEELLALQLQRGIDLDDPRSSALATLPDTLYGVVMARIDQLSERDKSVLKVASVIGRTFRASWVWSTAPELGGAGAVSRSLDGLERAELIARPAAAGDGEHLFRHVTTRDVAYDSLAFALRLDLHERVAAHVEERYADTLEQYVDTLAHHYSLSANVEKQRVYLRLAADMAKATYANTAALDYYERLLPLLDRHESVEVLLAMGSVREHVGEWSAAEDAYEEAFERASAEGDSSAVAEARRARGMLLAHAESLAEARTMLEQARDELGAAGDDAGVVRALEGLAYVSWKQSDLDTSLAYSREHLRAAEARQDSVAISMAVEQMGLAYWHQGKHDLARASFEHAVEVAAAAGNSRGVIHACNDLAGLHWERLELAEALERTREGMQAAEEIGYRNATGVMVGNAAEVFRLRGELDQALAHGVYGLDVVSEVGNRVGIASKVGNLALTLAAMEDNRAERMFEHAIALARGVETPYFLCEFLHHSADWLFQQGRYQEAITRNDEALEIAHTIGRRDIEAPAELLSVRARVSAGMLGVEEAEGELRLIAAGRDGGADEADVRFVLWSLTGEEQHRAAAASFYRDAHVKAPLAVYRQRYRLLTGESLDPPPALPPLLTEPIAEVDVDALMGRVEMLAVARRTATPV
jgi:class 3 adenylate cyclase/tetratricopeptide (TPR) repeat protein